MVCTKCGFECGDSKFCPKCGTKLVRECKKCGAALSDGDFCPSCGTDNSEKVSSSGWGTASSAVFIVTIVLSAIKAFSFFSVHGYFRFMFNNCFYRIPYIAFAAVYALLAVAIIVFSCLYRNKGKKGFGITAIVCAGILNVANPFSPTLWIILVGTIIHYISVLKESNNSEEPKEAKESKESKESNE